MSKKKKVVHHHSAPAQKYNDAWIRERFRDFQTTGAQFTNWMNQRTAQLKNEKQMREANQSAISKLGLDAAVAQEKLAGLGRGQAGLAGDIRGLSSDFTGALGGISDQIAVQKAALANEAELRKQGLGDIGDTISGQGGALTDIAKAIEGQQGQITKQQEGLAGLTGDYSKLSQQQQANIKNLFNLAAQGKNVRGVKTSQGLTFTQRPGSGVGGMNRDALTFGSLNLA